MGARNEANNKRKGGLTTLLMRGSITMKNLSMLVFLITSVITLQENKPPRQHQIRVARYAHRRKRNQGVPIESVRGGRAYSRRAGTLCRFGSLGLWGREEELPPGSAPPPLPRRGPSLSSGSLFCDISGRHATPRLASPRSPLGSPRPPRRNRVATAS